MIPTVDAGESLVTTRPTVVTDIVERDITTPVPSGVEVIELYNVQPPDPDYINVIVHHRVCYGLRDHFKEVATPQ